MGVSCLLFLCRQHGKIFVLCIYEKKLQNLNARAKSYDEKMHFYNCTVHHLRSSTAKKKATYSVQKSPSDDPPSHTSPPPGPHRQIHTTFHVPNHQKAQKAIFRTRVLPSAQKKRHGMEELQWAAGKRQIPMAISAHNTGKIYHQ